MFYLNAKPYKLCLLDTNVISNILKGPLILPKIFDRFPIETHIYYFSAFTITEIRQSDFIYSQFIKLFSIFPSLILKGLDNLFNDELSIYNKPNGSIEPWVLSPLWIRAENMTPDQRLSRALSMPDIVDKEKRWLKSRQDILDGIISNINNYPPENNSYSIDEIRDFVELTSLQQIMFRAPQFCQNEISNNRIIDTHNFPTIRSLAYMTFYKFYSDQRKPILSDVFDLLITSLLPYVEVFITEGHQADSIKKASKIEPSLFRVEPFSIKEL